VDTEVTGTVPGASPLPSLSYVLTELEVYNWGAFESLHSAQIDLEGTAIIGATGSGKTTLVDALMTLLTANPRYNLASSGGHESDRDLVSYCRGVSGAGNNSGSNDHIARPGKTVTGISARFSDGDRQLCIAAILWLEDSSSSASDLQRLWIFSEVEGQDLSDWLEIRQSGGARALKQLSRETVGLHITANKQEYLTHLRRFFEVGENAFTLLNRAAGLKQLNSIDEIFRELVLEDTSAFDRAAEVANEFDNLTAIHKELEVARQQQNSLKPIASGWEQRQQFQMRLALHRELLRVLPLWFAEHAHRLWGDLIEALDRQITERSTEINDLRAQMDVLTVTTNDLRDKYMQAGGASIEGLREQIELQQSAVDTRQRHAREYRLLTSRLGLSEDLTAEALLHNQATARESREIQWRLLEEQKLEARKLGAAEQLQEDGLKALQQELEQVESRPGSNIRGDYHRFRSDLASHLMLEEGDLPFVAELVEVKPEESRWRGAIERAIGGQRLRLLVPPSGMNRALAWINQRDNRLHVRLLEGTEPDDLPTSFADGFVRKLKFKPHAFQKTLKHLLIGLDRHCVASTEELHRTPHGMTVQGTMSGKSGFFDKQDQRRLDQDWMTGFDNKDRLEQLANQINAAKKALGQSHQHHEAAQARADATQDRLTFTDLLLKVHFTDIDLPGAQASVDALHARLQALTEPDSDAQAAYAYWQEAQASLKALGELERAADISKGKLETERDGARDNQQSAFRRLGTGMSDTERDQAAAHLATPTLRQIKQFPELERERSVELQSSISQIVRDLAECENELTRLMERAQKIDTGALAEVDTKIFDVPKYLERLRVLTEEALPEKLERFLSYLNQSSDQGVTQLLTDISNEVSMIEERIEDLNRTLRRVDFQPERYLRLEPQRIVHESLRQLQQAQRHLRSAAMKDDLGESHFKALENMVTLLRDASERKKTISARALLDPRYRLQFAVSTIERGTGAVIETRTGSQGGSGGEKESIASYVLTASLSYALCPQDSTRPLFGTIVLDEAFSKSSQAVAGRIIKALNEFGLHPLFVTPNKELRLLRQHTRSAILIHRRGQQATMTSLSWEEIEAHARERNSKQHEISS
jgi:uncharacterized protein YPO0396